MRKKVTILFDDPDYVDIVIDYLYRKKIIKKIIEKNDKTSPFYVIMDISIEKYSLEKILNKIIKNKYLVR